MYLEDLIKRLKIQTGDANPDEDVEIWDEKVEEAHKKLSGGRIEYGSKVIIVWDDSDPNYPEEEYILTDYGYITCIPGCYETPDVGAIIHIPEPWADKGPGDPEWITLTDLLLLPDVKEVKIEE